MLPASRWVSSDRWERGGELVETDSVNWPTYLARFHARRPGITERVLLRAHSTSVGTPYEWLATEVVSPDVTDRSPSTVLDLGCGSGPMKTVLPDSYSYVGIDLSFDELQEAQRRGRRALINADALELPLASNSISCAVSSMAVMLLSPIEMALDETFRVLKDGGTFAFIRPSATPFLLRDLMVGASLALSLGGLPAMPQRFSRRRIQYLLEKSGFNAVRHETRRFSLSLRTLEDAQLVVDSLYLPKVPEERRSRAAARLASMASLVPEVPISVALTVAQKSRSSAL